MAAIYIKLGDVAQAEAVLRRNLPVLQQARTSGFPLWRSNYATFGQGW
jgi:hypothetical protein